MAQAAGGAGLGGRLAEARATLERQLRDKAQPWTRWLDLAERRTGLDRLYLVLGGTVFVALWLVFGFAGELICNSIAFAYPAYMSMKALESPQKDDDTKWLTYWVVFAVFSIVEYFSDFIVGWVPMYWLMKCVFVIWCFNPTEYNGSLVIYHRVIRPYYHKHHGRIDQLADSDFKDVVKSFARKVDKSIERGVDKLDYQINKSLKAVGKKLDRLHDE